MGPTDTNLLYLSCTHCWWGGEGSAHGPEIGVTLVHYLSGKIMILWLKVVSSEN
jgi:hypothetical protein